MKLILLITLLFASLNTSAINLNEYQNFSCDITTKNQVSTFSGKYDYDWEADWNITDKKMGEVAGTLKDGRSLLINLLVTKQPIIFIGVKIGSEYQELELISNDLEAINLMSFTDSSVYCSLK